MTTLPGAYQTAHASVCVRACVHVSVCVSACLRVSVSACLRVCVSACVHACVHVCVHVGWVGGAYGFMLLPGRRFLDLPSWLHLMPATACYCRVAVSWTCPPGYGCC